MSLTDLTERSLASITAADTLKALEDLRIHILGKSGELTSQLKELCKLGPDERKEKGVALNQVKEKITAALEAKKTTL